MTKDQIAAFAVGVAFTTVVFFAGYARGELTSQRTASNDLLSRDVQLMTPQECVEAIIGAKRGNK